MEIKVEWGVSWDGVEEEFAIEPCQDEAEARRVHAQYRADTAVIQRVWTTPGWRIAGEAVYPDGKVVPTDDEGTPEMSNHQASQGNVTKAGAAQKAAGPYNHGADFADRAKKATEAAMAKTQRPKR